MTHPMRIATLSLIALVAIAVAFTSLRGWINRFQTTQPAFGITFSWTYAQELGFAPEEMYTAMLDDLGVRRVRLPIYWSQVEVQQGQYQWDIPDRLVALSQDRGVALTVVVGMRVPRWPECYIPTWVQSQGATERQRKTLSFIQAAVERYRNSSAVIRWQVENEPFFPYGECPVITPVQLQERMDLVRALDDRPIQITVSGEMEPWRTSALESDVLGISMYRKTWNGLFGYFVYPFSPEFYAVRAGLVRDDVERVIVSELQAEPWFPSPRDSKPLTQWYDAFTKQAFEDNIAFVRKAGFSEVYLWGAEWWYALKAAGDDRLWETAKTVF